jgi:hypothetical protein
MGVRLLASAATTKLEALQRGALPGRRYDFSPARKALVGNRVPGQRVPITLICW